MFSADPTLMSKGVLMRGAVLFLLALGCAPESQVAESLVSTPETPAQNDDDTLIDDEVDEVVEDTRVCDDFVTDPHNACDGHDDFTMTLLEAADADGDGDWEAGEQMVFTVRFESAGEHMAYPGMFVDGPGDLVKDETFPTQQAAQWYGIDEDMYYDVDFAFTADEAAAGKTAEFVFTAMALNCANQDPQWSDCPHPTPLLVEEAIVE